MIIGDPPQRLWDATEYRGLNRSVVNDLTRTIDHDEKIETVPKLLSMGRFGRRNVGDKKLDLLRQALIDSGMPEEFPWPWDYTTDDGDKLLRGLALIAPTFEELPMITKKEVASILRVRPKYGPPPGTPDISDSQLKRCATLYAERRREILAIVGWEE